MKKEGNLIKNTFILALGKISTQFVSFLLLPLYTKILSTEDYGMVDLLNVFVFLLLPIVTLSISTATFRYIIDSKSIEEKKIVVSTSLFEILINLVLFTVIYAICSIFIKMSIENFTFRHSEPLNFQHCTYCGKGSAQRRLFWQKCVKSTADFQTRRRAPFP